MYRRNFGISSVSVPSLCISSNAAIARTSVIKHSAQLLSSMTILNQLHKVYVKKRRYAILRPGSDTRMDANQWSASALPSQPAPEHYA